ncbi:hypothetical protein F5146DRAFT_994592 [Armillaria mellea]|nr:hypothetical protein F5146DRAFT_994592 [Armillaria mellea]
MILVVGHGTNPHQPVLNLKMASHIVRLNQSQKNTPRKSRSACILSIKTIHHREVSNRKDEKTTLRSSKHKRPLDAEHKDISGLPNSLKCHKTGSGSLSPRSEWSQSRKSSSKQNPSNVTQKDLAKAKLAQKAQQKQAWNMWLANGENQWSPEEDPNYKQEVRWQVTHYSDGALEGTFQGEALQEGRQLYDEKMKGLDDKYKKRHEGRSRPVPETYMIFEKKGSTGCRRPPGSWWERVYENGKKIGYWLVLHFDPDVCEGLSLPHPNREKRFWPIENGYPKW